MKLSTGKVVGGYNANSWSSPVLGPENIRLWNSYYSPNLERTGFLFSLTTEFKHKQNDRQAMIVSFRGFKTNQRFHNQTHACKISQKNLYIACIMSG